MADGFVHVREIRSRLSPVEGEGVLHRVPRQEDHSGSVHPVPSFHYHDAFRIRRGGPLRF